MPRAVLVVTDSHKDIASSREVGEWIAAGLRQESEGLDIRVLPIADGGEGTIDALISEKGGEIRYCDVHDPLFRRRKAKIGLLGDAERTAVIEIAEASGSALLKPEERDTMVATSYGTGEMILCAIGFGCRRIIVGLGGSIVSDGGMGMAQSLGAKFFSASGVQLRPIKNQGFNALSLADIASIDLGGLRPEIKDIPVVIAADVSTRLLGPAGQARTFGPQKGATEAQIKYIEEGLGNWSKILEQTFGEGFDVPYAGAAGGLGSGIAAFCGGELRHGIKVVMEETGLHDKLVHADIVITGEGRLDRTSLHGKASTVIAKIAADAAKSVIGIFGTIDGDERNYADCFETIINAREYSGDQTCISREVCQEAMVRAARHAGTIIQAGR